MKETIEEVPVWIQLSGLPMEFLNNKILPQIVAVIGRPLKIDNYTQNGSRGKFARACVLMNIRMPIQQGLWIDTQSGSFFQSIAYENLHSICFNCGMMGHSEGLCRSKKVAVNESAKTSDMSNEKGMDMCKTDNEVLLEPWIQVQRRKKFSPFQKRTNNEERNLFKVLNNPAFEGEEEGKTIMKKNPISNAKEKAVREVWKEVNKEVKDKEVAIECMEVEQLKVINGNRISNQITGRSSGKQAITGDGIYASTNYKKRNLLWNLYKEVNLEQLPWIFVGDMNCIRDSSEKLGGRNYFFPKAIKDFDSFIDEAGLLEPNAVEPLFTWTNNRKGNARIQAKLDRVLFNAKWLDLNMDIKVKHMQRIDSDHIPVTFSVYRNRNDRKGEKHLYLNTFWFEYSETADIVEKIWKDGRSNKSSIMEIQKCSAVVLSCWNKSKIGSLEGSLRDTLYKLSILENKDAAGWMSENEIVNMDILARRAGALSKQIQLKWWSKARVKWIEEGEKNSRYFHNIVKLKRRRSRIESLEVGDITVEDDKCIVEAFATWYERLWKENEDYSEDDSLFDSVE
ncbi:hypothetical protein Cni_G25031 [Canna indica]|uniref:Zinc knuckle CX2CX4HX4C domain-containing protein n=1 Tax=Canna indica TaxID=4628 RepID=A0AAQ3QLZ6_9LILI|nr:hypothetical protein Cni_G25031 [Canna indica]